MLRLFGVFVLVLIFLITVIPYSYANHDAVPSYVQNNTGWNQEMFHEYKFYEFSNEFGYFLIPYDVDGLIINNSHNISTGSGRIGIMLEYNDDESFKLLIPNFLVPEEYFSELFFTPSYLGGGVVVKPILKNIFNTHTHLEISLHEYKSQQQIDIVIRKPSFIDTNPMISSGMLNEITKENYDYIFPPLKQTQNGIESHNILCKENLELILQPSSSSACVKSESISKLIERGWVKTS